MEKMKPGIINSAHLNESNQLLLWRWLALNGVRHYVPIEAQITCTGNRLIVPTFDIERVGQKNKKWARNRWIWIDGEKTLPIKNRTYRIRTPFPYEAMK